MEKRAPFNIMPATNYGKTFEELAKEDGWEEVHSFRSRSPEQWNAAVDMAYKILDEGGWELQLANESTDLGIKDGIVYLFKRKK